MPTKKTGHNKKKKTPVTTRKQPIKQVKPEIKTDSKQKPIIYEFHTDRLYNFKNEKLADITKGISEYQTIYNALWNYIFDDYTRKDNFIKVFISNDMFVYLTCAELLLHLIFWKYHVLYSNKLKKKIPITEHHIWDLAKSFNQKDISRILEHLSIHFFDLNENDPNTQDELSFYTSLIIDDLVELAEGFATISANTISIYEIVQLAHRNNDFRKCIDTQLDDSKSIRDLELELKHGEQRVKHAILADNKNCLAPYIRSARLTDDQFTQMFYAVGPRTDIDKTILPMIMKGNFLKGYQYPSDAYMDAITGRDAQIAKYINVRDSGYLSRKINLACLNTHIDYDVDDCGTKHTINYTVTNEFFLQSIDKKFIVQSNGKLHKVSAHHDKHLIGKTVQLRSHILCLLDNNRVCKTCFGGKTSRLIGTHIGALPSIKLANPLSKRIMRAKHFTTTSSIDVSSEILDKYFNVDTSKLFLKPEIDVKNIFIIIPREYVEEIVEGNIKLDDDTVEPMLPLESFILQDNGKEHLIECEGLYLAFTDELLSEYKKFIIDMESDNAMIPLSKIDTDAPLFNTIIITEEVSRYLAQIKRLINSSATKNYTSVSELLHDILQVLINSGMLDTNIIHIETLVYQLIRDSEKLYLRPDFTQDNPSYCLLPLAQSILKKDLFTALAFEKLKSQIRDGDSFIKNQSGIFDPIFSIEKPAHVKKILPSTIAKAVASA